MNNWNIRVRIFQDRNRIFGKALKKNLTSFNLNRRPPVFNPPFNKPKEKFI